MSLLYEIKKIEEKDIELVAKVSALIFNNDFDNEYKHFLYEAKENPCAIILVAKAKQIIYGYIDFWITFDSATICNIATFQEYRNKGVATSLIKEMFKYLIKENVMFITLEVRKSNVPAINLYKKFGFNVVSVKPNYYKDGEDALYMIGDVYYVKNNTCY